MRNKYGPGPPGQSVLKVQVPPKMSVRAQIIKNGPNRIQIRRFGLKIVPEACQDRSRAFGMGLTHSKGPSPAKKSQKVCPKTARYWSECRTWSHAVIPSLGARARGGVGRAPAFCVARCQTWTQVSHPRCPSTEDFGNRTVTFRIDHTPLHRIAVQFEWA